jgi:hypothetical protein
MSEHIESPTPRRLTVLQLAVAIRRLQAKGTASTPKRLQQPKRQPQRRCARSRAIWTG